MGNYKEMPEGVREMQHDGEDDNPEAQEYVQDLMEKASSAAGGRDEDQEEEEAY